MVPFGSSAILLGAEHPTVLLTGKDRNPSPSSEGEIMYRLDWVKAKTPPGTLHNPVISLPEGSGKITELVSNVPHLPGIE
jgi:hypothetical protein